MSSKQSFEDSQAAKAGVENADDGLRGLIMKRSGRAAPEFATELTLSEVSWVLAAAWSRRNGRAVRAGARMAEEGADLVGGFGRKDVLELAGLLLDFGLAVHGQAVGEQALGQAMAADDVGGALAAAGGEFDDQAAVADRDCRSA